ncbi:carboxypeptidase-like regulatory domain-containing protein [Pontibacter virosus]|nr:carboxypeptidase-like regulatory domain-containing protein [Pontibacter virosus]
MLILLFTIGEVLSQSVVHGTVISKLDKLPLPGASIQEKGRENGTATASDGRFSLEVGDPNAILIVSFIGYIQQEVRLKGRDSIQVELKSSCFKDFFDHQLVGIHLMTGIINNPFGAGIDLSLPAFYRDLTLKGGVEIQSNFDKNKVSNAQIELKHILVTCNFDLDAKWHHRRVELKQGFSSDANSWEASFNFSRPFLNIGELRLIAGYGRLNFNKNDMDGSQSSSGPLVGLGTSIGELLRLSVTGKAAIYRDKVEYQGELSRQFNKINTFARFYSFDSFTEFSLGAGVNFGYRLKK